MKRSNSFFGLIFLEKILISYPRRIEYLGKFLSQIKIMPFVLVLMGVMSSASFAAVHYVRSGGGAGSGSSWSDSYNALPSTLVRGDIYYIAGGTYSGRTFNTAASGASVITIKAATEADHGTDTGWNTSYSVENTQAIWTSGLTFTTSYWVFDGSVGSMTATPSAYGFSFGSNLTNVAYISSGATATTNITLAHIYAKATSSDIEKLFLQGGNGTPPTHNVTISHCFLDGWQGAMMTRAPYDKTACDGWVLEYSLLYNGYSSSANHGEWINPNERPMTNFVARYNVFKGASGPAGHTGTIVANNANNTGAKIYGNVFDSLVTGNGVISGTSAGQLSNAVIYNNSFVNCFMATNTVIGGPGSGNVVYNNIFYNMSAQINSSTTDYNYYVNATGAPSESHKQTGSGNPFVNSSAGNYHLSAATSNGITLSSPYNVDADGSARGADGVWDRGAFEYVASPSRIPSPPMVIGVD